MRKTSMKVITIFCMLSLFITMLAGCGAANNKVADTSQTAVAGSSETKTGDTDATEGKQEFANKNIEVAAFEGGYGKAYWEDIASKFETAYPGVKVTLTTNPKIGEILRPRFVSGDVPDFIYMNPSDASGLLPSAVKEGGLARLDDVFNSKTLDSDKLLKDILLDGFLDPCKPNGDGKIYYAPAYYYTGGLFYNKTYFESKGLNSPKTWDEFLALGEVAKQDGKALFTYQGIYPSYNEMVFYPAIASAGGEQAINDIFNYTEGAFQSDAVKKVMGIFAAIAEKDYILKGTVAMNHTQAQTEFINGNALFLPCGSWLEGEMKDAITAAGQNFSVGFTGTPVFQAGDQQYCFGGIEAFVIPAKAKNIELAKEFLKYNYTTEAVQLNAEKAKGVMPVKGAVELFVHITLPLMWEIIRITIVFFILNVFKDSFANINIMAAGGLDSKSLFGKEFAVIREGEVLIVDLWYLYNARKLAKERDTGMTDEIMKETMAKCPPPRNIDFRIIGM